MDDDPHANRVGMIDFACMQASCAAAQAHLGLSSSRSSWLGSGLRRLARCRRLWPLLLLLGQRRLLLATRRRWQLLRLRRRWHAGG